MILRAPFNEYNLRSKEFLFTNNFGGYCSSTLAGINTRSYHGLLVVAHDHLRERIVLLSKLEEQVYISGKEYFLSANQYKNKIFPQGYLLFSKIEFRLDGIDFYYQLDNILVKKITFLKDNNKIVISYEYLGQEECLLKIYPLLALRSYHTVRKAPYQGLAIRSAENTNSWSVSQEYLPKIYFDFTQPVKKIREGDTYYNFKYTEEEKRGLASEEDLYSPFGFEVVLTKKPFSLTVYSDQLEKSIIQDKPIPSWVKQVPDLLNIYQHASDFVFQIDQKPKIMAGFPWFTYWGRDTLIALPGLLLTTGKFKEAKVILQEIINSNNQGLLFNVAEEGSGSFQYHSVDASLLLFQTIDQYISFSGDVNFFKENKEKLHSILEYFIKGTLFNIYLDKNFLLHAEEEGKALTWMDACHRDQPFTPRRGYAVEINAIFYNALRVFDFYLEQIGKTPLYISVASRLKKAFLKYFWNGTYCYDVVSKGGLVDLSFRPNQLFACALRFPLLDIIQAQVMIKNVQRLLLTPRGLRTLAPDDPKYIPHYAGNPYQRDAAYHQGTVWLWLYGIYANALYYAFGKNNPELTRFRLQMDALLEYLNEEHFGLVPEIFEAEPPHVSKGCIHQAWSAGELLRIYFQYFSSKTLSKSKSTGAKKFSSIR